MSQTTTRFFRPGAWFGIFGDHATVLLPPSEKARAARLWELVDDGAGFDEVLDALISGGLRDLPGFVLISERDRTTKVVVRGAAHARFLAGGEPVELRGSDATTWVERSLTDVTSTVVELVTDQMTDELTDEVTDEVHDGAVEVETLAVRNGLARVGRIAYPPEPPEPEEPEADRAREVEEDDDTVDTTAAEQTPPPVARLRLSDGEVVDVDRVVVVGRAPDPRRVAGHDPRLVTVASPAQEISSTHLEVRPGAGDDEGAAVVSDLGSTNGSVLVQPGEEPEELRPGVPVRLRPGALLDLGDGVTIEVLEP